MGDTRISRLRGTSGRSAQVGRAIHYPSLLLQKITYVYEESKINTIYTTPQQLNQLLAENRLRKDPTGDVEILERFWKPAELFGREDLVHPILIYADLLATGNERNIETAKIIYEEHIVRLIRED
jgi:hypothetical protein